MTRLLYAGRMSRSDSWCSALRALRPDIDLVPGPDGCSPDEVDILLYAPNGPISDLAPYAGVAAIQSLWAGVEALLENPTLPDVPLLRMVDRGMTIGMTDYVVGQVMRAHLGVAAQQTDQAAGIWKQAPPPLSIQRKVGIIGLGALGLDAAEKLAALRFDVSGWSRTAKDIPGIRCLHGPEGLQALLKTSEILVLLAPLTPETRGLIGAVELARMPKGSHVINAARGPLLDNDALLAALESRQIKTATIDVFEVEPPAPDHPFWTHPRVLITPHVASDTRIQTASETIIEQMTRFEARKPFLHFVDRDRGY